MTGNYQIHLSSIDTCIELSLPLKYTPVCLPKSELFSQCEVSGFHIFPFLQTHCFLMATYFLSRRNANFFPPSKLPTWLLFLSFMIKSADKVDPVAVAPLPAKSRLSTPKMTPGAGFPVCLSGSKAHRLSSYSALRTLTISYRFYCSYTAACRGQFRSRLSDSKLVYF